MENCVCVVCDEKINKVSHSNVPCEFCDFSACRSCYETYVKGEGVAKCMNKEKKNGVMVCDKEWSRSHMSKNMTKSFMSKDYKQMQEKRASDIQRALLPATIDFVNAEIERERMIEEIRNIDAAIEILKNRKTNLHYLLRQGGRSYEPFKIEASLFVRSCPSEDCRGYLNSTTWKCELCNMFACSECHVLKGDAHDSPHTCDPDTRATAQLLKKDTKPCPKCQEGIYKIDGCDQMWCVRCHTAFSWRTGKTEETIHNPHYYQWMRQHNNGNIPRNPGDIPGDIVPGELACNRGGNVTRYQLDMIRRAVNFVSNTKKYNCSVPLDTQSHLDSIVSSRNHLNLVVAPFFQRTDVDIDAGNRELRIAYLRNKIDEQTFVTRIQRKEKDNQKKAEILNVLELFSTVTTDLLLRSFEATRELLVMPGPNENLTWSINDTNGSVFAKKITAILFEADELVKHANELLADIGKTYAFKTKQISLDEGKNWVTEERPPRKAPAVIIVQ